MAKAAWYHQEWQYCLELPKLCSHPGWWLMRAGYHTCFHALYDENKNKIYIYTIPLRWDLSDTSPCQSEAQGCFMVGVAYELRLMCSREKNSCPHQAINIVPLKWVKTWVGDSLLRSRCHSIQTNHPARMSGGDPEGHVSKIFPLRLLHHY